MKKHRFKAKDSALTYAHLHLLPMEEVNEKEYLNKTKRHEQEKKNSKISNVLRCDGLSHASGPVSTRAV